MNLIKKVLILLVCLSVQSKVLPAAAVAAPAKVGPAEAAIRAALDEAKRRAEAPMREGTKRQKLTTEFIKKVSDEIEKIPWLKKEVESRGKPVDYILLNINEPYDLKSGLTFLQFILCGIKPNDGCSYDLLMNLLLNLNPNLDTIVPLKGHDAILCKGTTTRNLLEAIKLSIVIGKKLKKGSIVSKAIVQPSSKEISDEINNIPHMKAYLESSSITIETLLKNINSVVDPRLNITFLQKVVLDCEQTNQSNLKRLIKLLLDFGANTHIKIPDNHDVRINEYAQYIGLDVLEIAQSKSLKIIIPIIEEAFFSKCAMCCSTENLKKCGQCNQIQYCSTACQRSNWKQHKNRCHSSSLIAEFTNLQELINQMNVIINSLGSLCEAASPEGLSDRMNALMLVYNHCEINCLKLLPNSNIPRHIFDSYITLGKTCNIIVKHLTKLFWNNHDNKLNKLGLFCLACHTDEASARIIKMCVKCSKCFINFCEECIKTHSKKGKCTGKVTTKTRSIIESVEDTFASDILTIYDTESSIVDTSPTIDSQTEDLAEVATVGAAAIEASSVTAENRPEERGSSLPQGEDKNGPWIIAGERKKDKSERPKGVPIPMPVVPATRESTQCGPRPNPMESQAIIEARTYPARGIMLNVRLQDSRWPYSDGWRKMVQHIWLCGNRIEIHYLVKINPTTGEHLFYNDFKIKRY